MSIFVETLEGERYDLKAMGLHCTRFDIRSPNLRHSFETVEGSDGLIDLGTNFDGREIHTEFSVRAGDFYDYLLLRGEMFRLFDGRSQFFLIDKHEPRKRWKVKTETAFDPNRTGFSRGKVEIRFIAPFPYAESYGTTLDPFTFTDELWQIGQGVISEDLVYAHNTSTFRIYNGSDIPIDPRKIPLKITYKGTSNNLRIRNNTTGDEWAFGGISGENDTILLDGVRSLRNGLTIFGQTNRKLITLERGWNDFTLTGASGSFLISFDFRYYTI